MAFVQANGNSVNSSGNWVQAFGSNVGAGSTLTCYICMDRSKTPSTPTDTLGNTYVSQDTADDVAQGEKGWCWVAKSPSGGANTVTVSVGTAAEGCIAITEHSGRDTTTPVTGKTHNVQASPGTGTDGVTCGPVTAVAGDDIVLFVTNTQSFATNKFTAGTGFTERSETGSGGSDQLDCMTSTKDNVSAGSTTATATTSLNESTVSIVVFLAAAGGGGGVTLSSSIQQVHGLLGNLSVHPARD